MEENGPYKMSWRCQKCLGSIKEVSEIRVVGMNLRLVDLSCLCSSHRLRGHTFHLCNKECTERGQSTLETLICGVLYCPGLRIPNATMELFSLMTIKRVGFQNSRGQMVALKQQIHGKLNYHNSSWMGQLTGGSHE